MIEISDSDAARLRKLAAEYTDAAWTDQYANGGGVSWSVGYRLADELGRILHQRVPAGEPRVARVGPVEDYEEEP